MGSAMVSFEDGVKARLKDIVAELIPEDRWVALVQQAVREFERDTLPSLVKTELAARYKQAIAEEFAKPEWATKWGASGAEASDKVKALLIEAAPMVLASMFAASAQQVVFDMQTAIQQRRF